MNWNQLIFDIYGLKRRHFLLINSLINQLNTVVPQVTRQAANDIKPHQHKRSFP